jgi:hypothetical protein
LPSKSIGAVAAIALSPGGRTYCMSPIAASRLGGPVKARQIAPNRRKQAQAPRRRTRPAYSWPASVSLSPLLHSYCNLSPEFESLSRFPHVVVDRRGNLVIRAEPPGWGKVGLNPYRRVETNPGLAFAALTPPTTVELCDRGHFRFRSRAVAIVPGTHAAVRPMAYRGHERTSRRWRARPRNGSTIHGGASTTFPSCQSLTVCAVSVAIRL